MVGDTELERLVVRLMGDASHYQKTMVEAQGMMDGVVKSIDKASMSLGGFNFGMRRFAQQALASLGPIGIAMGGVGLAVQSISMAATAEKMQTDMAVMLQSGDEAKRMMADLTEFAAKTPLELPQLVSASKQLLQFGVAGEDIIPALRMIGDSVMGDSERFQRMALVFGQTRQVGRLMGGDLIQMVNAGFNPLEEMSRKTGKSVAVLREEMSKGRISFAMVQEAFRTATSEGGRFFKGMEQGSKTLTGLFSTMKDDIGAAMRTLGEEITTSLNLKEVVKSVSAGAQALTEAFKSLPPDVRTVISAIISLTGVVLAGHVAWLLLAPAVVGTLQIIVGAVSTIIGVIGGLGTVFAGGTAGVLYLVAALGALAGTVVVVLAVAAAVAALGYGAFKLSEWLSGNREEQAKLNAEMERSAQLFDQEIKIREKHQQAVLATAAAIQDVNARGDFLQKSLEDAKKELSGNESAARAAAAQLAEYDGVLARIADRKTLAAFRQELDEANRRVEVGRQNVQALQEQLKKTTAPALDPALKASLTKLRDELELEAKSMGATGVEAKLFKLQLDQMPPAMLEEVRAIALRNEEAKKRLKDDKDLKDNADKLIGSLRDEAEAMGKTSDEVKIAKLVREGLNDETRKELEAMAYRNEELKKHQDLMKEGRDLTKEMRTPTEVYQDRMKDLGRMLEEGAVSQDVYNRAAKDAKKKLDDAGNSARNAKQELQALDAVLVGSGEAYQRMTEYQSRVFGANRARQGMLQGAEQAMSTAPPSVTAQPVSAGPAGGPDTGSQQVQLLKAAVNHLATLASRPGLQVVSANLK